MRLTQHSDYALRLLIYLGVAQGRRSTISEVAEHYGISRNHLMKVAYRLGSLGYLRNTRGKGGGIALKGAPAEVNVGDVVRRMEGGFPLAECMDPEGHCVISPNCYLHDVLQEALQAFLAVLDRYTLADLVHNPVALAGLLQLELGQAAGHAD